MLMIILTSLVSTYKIQKNFCLRIPVVDNSNFNRPPICSFNNIFTPPLLIHFTYAREHSTSAISLYATDYGETHSHNNSITERMLVIFLSKCNGTKYGFDESNFFTFVNVVLCTKLYIWMKIFSCKPFSVMTCSTSLSVSLISWRSRETRSGTKIVNVPTHDHYTAESSTDF